MIIDIVQDIVCPWCRIGKANLDHALATSAGAYAPVEIRLRPFQLNAQTPLEGTPFLAYMQQLTGSEDPSPIWDRVDQAGARVGLVFNWNRIQKMPNTLLAHTLLAAAPEPDRERLLAALHTAYFENGRDIGDQETLLAISAELGLDRRALAAALNFPDFRAMVSAQITEIARSGINGVPFFVFNNAVGLSGAQPPDVMLQALQKAAESPAPGAPAE